jgi:hypothetical protein
LAAESLRQQAGALSLAIAAFQVHRESTSGELA